MTVASPGRSVAPSGAWLLAIGLFAGAVFFQVQRDRLAPPPADDQVMWLQSPAAARRLALSFPDIVADIYWMRAVVHYGGERRADGDKRYALLYPLLDLATSLDVHFDVAARLGAIFLSEGYPGGPGRPDQAIALLEKGLSHDPDRWQYRHDIGFVHYWWLKDYKAAARQFELGAALPGGPVWLRTLAGVTLAKGGDRASAKALWQELLKGADLEWVTRSANYHMDQLRALDDIDALTAAVAQYQQRFGQWPARWDDLRARGLLSGEAVDPTGSPYVIGADGRVTLSPSSSLHPMPTFEAHQ